MAKKTKPSYSASHERDEGRKMKSSLIRSVLGALFAWVPLIGLIFGLSGFIGACRRVTSKYRVRLVLLTLFTVIVLAADVGVLTWEVYAYTRSPKIVSMTGECVWKLLTGAADSGECLDGTVDAWLHPEKLMESADGSEDDGYQYTPEGIDYDEQGGAGLGMEEEVRGVLITATTEPAEEDVGEPAEIVPPDGADEDTKVIEAGSEISGIPEGLPSVEEIMSGDKD